MFSVFVFLFHSERAVYESKALRVDAYLRKEESCRKGGTMKLLKVDTLAQARERLLKAAKECLPETEQVALADASDRILAEDIVSGEMIPAFRRSSVDGYAVCSNPVYFGIDKTAHSEGAGRSRDRTSGGIKD